MFLAKAICLIRWHHLTKLAILDLCFHVAENLYPYILCPRCAVTRFTHRGTPSSGEEYIDSSVSVDGATNTVQMFTYIRSRPSFTHRFRVGAITRVCYIFIQEKATHRQKDTRRTEQLWIRCDVSIIISIVHSVNDADIDSEKKYCATD